MTADGLRFVPLGVGDAHSARWYSSCLALESGGVRLLFDCPHPIRKILREAGDALGGPLDVPSFEAVLLSHLHADHASGLEGWGFYWHFGLNRRAIVLAHPEVLGRLWEHLAPSMSTLRESADGSCRPLGLDDYFDLRPLSESAPVEFGPFRIWCRPTIHHIPCFAMRIEAGGRTLGLSADTAYDPELIAWLSQADLIVHEANVGIHTPYEKLAALPAELRARMRLIHYPDDFDKASSVIEPLEVGRLYEV